MVLVSIVVVSFYGLFGQRQADLLAGPQGASSMTTTTTTHTGGIIVRQFVSDVTDLSVNEDDLLGFCPVAPLENLVDCRVRSRHPFDRSPELAQKGIRDNRD